MGISNAFLNNAQLNSMANKNKDPKLNYSLLCENLLPRFICKSMSGAVQLVMQLRTGCIV